MTTLIARIASIATLALAAAPVAALVTPAHAAGQERVYVSDLNMATAAGKATYEKRIDHAVRHFCSTEQNLTERAACATAVRQEADAKAASNVQFASRI
jgi:UrcA family protein